ncbi:hypothetical protein N8B27_13985 (plasmid) [Enterococcus faecium]|nr:hypothetical protein [Enterococcus faecalis]
MEEIEWNNLTQNNKNNSGCGIIFMFVIVLGIVVLLITVKIVDYFANTPEEQIQRKLPEFERVPPYDPRDNSFQVKKLKESPNEMWFEVTVESSDFKEKKERIQLYCKGKSIKKIYF